MKWNNERLNCANQTPTEEFHIWWLLGVDNGGTHSHRTIPEPLKFRAMMKPKDLNGLVRRSVFGSAPLFGVGPAGDIAESRDGYEPSYCCDTGVDLATLAALLGGKTKRKSNCDCRLTFCWNIFRDCTGHLLSSRSNHSLDEGPKKKKKKLEWDIRCQD